MIQLTDMQSGKPQMGHVCHFYIKNDAGKYVMPVLFVPGHVTNDEKTTQNLDLLCEALDKAGKELFPEPEFGKMTIPLKMPDQEDLDRFEALKKSAEAHQ